MSRRIIIVGPKFFGYSSAIVEFLKKNKGIDALFIDERGSNNFFYKSIYRSLYLSRFFEFIIKKRRREIYRKIENYRPSDIIFISPEYMCRDDFTAMEQLKCKMMLYMWDSFSNKPSALPHRTHFDRCMTFDFEDSTNYGMRLLNLFAEPQLFNGQTRNSKKKYDVTFVGTIHSNRMKYLIQLTKICDRLKLKIKIHAYYGNYYYFLKAKMTELRSRVTIGTWDSLTKSEIAKIFHETSVVIDITHPNQRGLTSRTFEALAAGATILTNNKNAKKYLNKYANQIYVFSELSFEKDLEKALTNAKSQSLNVDTSYLGLDRFCEELLG